jgi:thiaminase
VDVNYDKRPDMPLWQAILTAKLAFSWGYYEVAKNICDSINNSGDPDASATTFADAGNARKR